MDKFLEKKIYSSYAFTENEIEKHKINNEIYKELIKKYKIYNGNTKDINLNDYDLIYKREACYNHGEYSIKSNKTNLTSDELALIFDNGNLCFGYHKEGNSFYYIFED